MPATLAVALMLCALLAGSAVAACVATGVAAPASDPPESTLTEEVEVRLVLVDTLAIDRAGRTVADLSRDDFELFVDYDPQPIDTLDRVCPAGEAADPRAVARPGDARPHVAPDAARRLVLAIDYMHLRQVERVDVLTRLRGMLSATGPSAEEVMVVAITGELRVEQVFTGDRQATLDTLERMERDISLWLPAFDHLHELRFFRSLDRLVDLLGSVPGTKAVVLYSNLPGPSASYDLAFERVAAKSTHARVAFYPVLARGLSETSSPRLARLAVETGGRFTENTNDLSLGYARAQRDLSCRYVLGFYDADPERGRTRRISVRVLRPGVRAVHSNNYQFPTGDEVRRTGLRSALLAPAMFAGGDVRAAFVPLRPVGPRRWEGLLVVAFPVDRETSKDGATLRDVAVSLRTGSRVAEAFQRRLTVRTDARAGDRVEALHVSRVVVKPGDYALAAAVADPAGARPWAAGVAVTLPAVPEEEVFVVTPVLGRRSPAGVTIVADDEEVGDEGDAPAGKHGKRPSHPDRAFDFEPLVAGDGANPDGEARIARDERPLLVLTHVCRSGRSESGAEVVVERRLRAADGRVVRRLPAAPARWPEQGPIHCLSTVDELGVADLAGGYAFEVTLTEGNLRADGRVPFAVDPRSPPR